MSGSDGGVFRWGFIGAGNIAHRALAPAVHAASGSVLQAVAARDVGRARELEPAGRTYDDYAALCADPDVDGVYISLPNDAHLPWLKHALAEGKHVLCEKPLTLDEAQTAEAFEAAAAADRLLVEAFWYRWHPRTRLVESMLAAGEIGDVQRVESGLGFGGVQPGNIRLDPTKGGGALYDVGCYPISVAHWALGDLDVASAEARYGAVDLETTAELVGGTGRAQVTCSIDSTPFDFIRIIGSAASVEFTDVAFMARRDVRAACASSTPRVPGARSGSRRSTPTS
jgi:predicted dehydrogenase